LAGVGSSSTEMRLYASTDALTIGWQMDLKSPGKSPRKPLKMAVRMVFVAWSLGGGMQSSVKWRTKRGVSSWRPPPGGAHAAHSIVSSMSFQNSFLRS